MSFLTDIRQPKVLMMKWGLHGPRLRLLFVFILIFMASSFLLIFRHLISQDVSLDIFDTHYHTGLYCNRPEKIVGEEGQIQFFKGAKQNLKLEQVHMVIRHGDRAPILLDTLPNSSPVHIPCRFNKTWSFYEELKEIRLGMSLFEVTGPKKYTLLQERDVCIGGQLTPVGFYQHLRNGKFLKRQYKDFIENVKDPDKILALSTDYDRTVQSAASLLYGMFGEIFRTNKIKIKVQDDKYRETHFLMDEVENQLYCPALAQKLKEIWKTDQLHALRKQIDPLRKQFAKIFKSHRGEIPSLDRLVDILYVRFCHNQGVPKGLDGKVTYSLTKNSFGLANQLITVKHMPTAELQALAILSQIVHKVSDLIKSHTNKGIHAHKLVLFSAHDTVVTPVMEALGAHDWRWPPYASRVVFELWRQTKETVKARSDDQFSIFAGYFIRVLYNGKDVTKDVKLCKGQLLQNQLCPVSSFVKFVSDDQFDGDNYFERIKNLCIGTEA